MDALSQVLQVVELSGAVFLTAEFTAPWCVLSKASDEICASYLPRSDRVVAYHLIAEGRCVTCLSEEKGSAVELNAGDVLVVPQGDAHLLGSTLDLEPAPSEQLLAQHVEMHPGRVLRFNYGGGGTPTRMICGFLTCDGVLGNPLLLSLPKLFKVNIGSGVESAWLASSRNYCLYTQCGVASIPCPTARRAGWPRSVTAMSGLRCCACTRSRRMPGLSMNWLATLDCPARRLRSVSAICLASRPCNIWPAGACAPPRMRCAMGAGPWLKWQARWDMTQKQLSAGHSSANSVCRQRAGATAIGNPVRRLSA
jgi:hypothetical protein